MNTITDDRKSEIIADITNGRIDNLEKYIAEEGLLEIPLNNDRQTPLMIAAQCGHREVAKYLIELGASVNARDLMIKTPLMMTTSVEIAQLLITEGADIKARDLDHKTPLIWAAYNGNSKVLEFLIRSGAEIDAVEQFSGNTALTAAVKYNHDDSMQILLDADASTTIKNRQLLSPLMLAVEQKNMVKIGVLLNYPHDLDEIYKYYSDARPEHGEFLKACIDNLELEKAIANDNFINDSIQNNLW